MNQGRPPLTALDDILSQTRHLLLSFNGPVCPLFADIPHASIAERLRTLLIHTNRALPAEVEKTEDWQKVLTYAATLSPQLAQSVESELTKLESASASTTRPTLHLHEMVTACRESGRSLAVVSNASATVVHSYLTDHSLDGVIGLVIARAPHEAVRSMRSQIEQAVSELDAEPNACTLLGAIPADIEAAQQAGTHTVGYAKGADDHDALANTAAGVIISSFADLTLRLRARPLPN